MDLHAVLRRRIRQMGWYKEYSANAQTNVLRQYAAGTASTPLLAGMKRLLHTALEDISLLPCGGNAGDDYV